MITANASGLAYRKENEERRTRLIRQKGKKKNYACMKTDAKRGKVQRKGRRDEGKSNVAKEKKMKNEMS